MSFDFDSNELREIEGLLPGEASGKLMDVLIRGQSPPLLEVSDPEEMSTALWDTGASISAVDQQYIALHPENFQPQKESIGIQGVGGHGILKVYLARSIQVGKVLFRNIRVVSVPQLRFEVPSGDMDFILGMNIIRRANWKLDLRSGLWQATPRITGRTATN